MTALPRYELQPDGRVAYLSASLPPGMVADPALASRLFAPRRSALPDGPLAVAYEVVPELGLVRLKHGSAAAVEAWARGHRKVLRAALGPKAAGDLRIIHLAATAEGVATLNETIHRQGKLDELHQAVTAAETEKTTAGCEGTRSPPAPRDKH